jgi:hypothetical protein
MAGNWNEIEEDMRGLGVGVVPSAILMDVIIYKICLFLF